MDKAKIIEWHKKLVTKGFHPPDLSAWVDKVDKTHEEIRKLIGGTHKIYKIGPSNEQHPIDAYTHKWVIDAIINCVPKYLEKYKFTADVFLYPTIKKAKGIGTAKHVLGYVERDKVQFPTPLGYTRVHLENYLARLGDAWNKANKSQAANIMISTLPHHFAQIGNMSCDNGSCFSIGGFNADKKYGVSITPNSFVIMVDADPFPEELGAMKVACRCMGILDPASKFMHTFNSRDKWQDGTFGLSLREIGHDLLGSKDLKIKVNSFKLCGGLNYQDNSNTYYPDKTNAPEDGLKVEIAKDYWSGQY